MNVDEIREVVQERVRPLLPETRAIVYDGCHKIYLALDDAEVEVFQKYGYGEDDDGSVLIRADYSNEEIMLATVADWYENSCGLRFIDSVRHTEPDANVGFERVISQFEIDEEEEDDE